MVEELKGVQNFREYKELKRELEVRLKENKELLEKLAKKEGLSIYNISRILLWRHLH